MEQKSHIIKILTYKLPFELANQMYNEYQGRIQETEFIMENSKYYSSLENHKSIVEIMLAISIFHKRVICNLDGALKFYQTVTTKADTESIRIGAYNFNGEEKNNILALVITYRNLLEKFGISPAIFNYLETKEFLLNIINLRKGLENDNNNFKRSIEDDLPF